MDKLSLINTSEQFDKAKKIDRLKRLFEEISNNDKLIKKC